MPIRDTGVALSSGVLTASTFAALAGLSAAVGTQVYIQSEAETRTKSQIGARELWLRDRWIRKADGSLYTRTVSQSSGGRSLQIYAGMPSMPAFSQIGTHTITADYVLLNGVVYDNSASTAELLYLYLHLYQAPGWAGSGGLAGMLAGSVRGGTNYSVGPRLLDTSSPFAMDLGYYGNSTTTGGSAEATVGHPIEMLVDLSAAGALTVATGNGRQTGLAVRRDAITTVQNFWEVGALDAGINPQDLYVVDAVQIELS